MALEVKDAFRNRPHFVDNAEGFVKMDVISPLESPEEIWLITFWRDEASFRAWHKSDAHRASHKFIPKGLKVVPGSTQVRLFEHVSS
jgi:heme-degrading monooxygenase HmoA